MIRCEISSIESSLTSITGQPSRRCICSRVFELLVDLDRSAYLRLPRIQRIRSPRISDRRCASIVSPTIFVGSIVNSSAGGSIPFTSGTFAVLQPR